MVILPMVYPRFGSIIEQSPVIIPSPYTIPYLVFSIDLFKRDCKARDDAVELCGVNSHSSMQPAANYKSFTDCIITNIFLIANKPFPDISNNTTLPLSTVITIFK